MKPTSGETLTQELAYSLGQHCKKLVEFRQISESDYYIQAMASDCPGIRNVNIVLESCVELRILDYVHGTLDLVELEAGSR